MQGQAQALSGTWRQTARGGYTITMREDEGVVQALGTLAAEPVGADRLHVGWGSFRNLDIVAARRSRAAVLCDVNENQRVIWQAVFEALGACSGCRAFTERLAKALPTTPRPRRFVESLPEWLASDLRRPDSWLYEAEPSRYDHVRELAQGGRIAVMCLDILEAGRARDVVAHSAAHFGTELAADTLYLSNLPWMLRQEHDIFGNPSAPFGPELMWKGLSELASDLTWVIRAEELSEVSSTQDLRWRTELARFPGAREASERAQRRVSR